MNSVTHKKCSSCGIDQLLTEYPPDKTRGLGVRSNCKECCRIKAYKYRKPKALSVKKRVYPEKKPLNKEAKKQYRREYYIKNKERTLLLTKIYRQENPEKSRGYTAKWRLSNPNAKEVQRLSENRRRAKIKLVENTLTKDEWIEICNFYENKCLSCGRKDLKLTIDHVIPIHLGGANSKSNVQPLCKSCNCKKHLKETDYRYV